MIGCNTPIDTYPYRSYVHCVEVTQEDWDSLLQFVHQLFQQIQRCKQKKVNKIAVASVVVDLLLHKYNNFSTSRAMEFNLNHLQN